MSCLSCLSSTTEFAELQEPVQKLHYDYVTFSHSTPKDFCIYAKNNHPLFSVFLSHPQHTYDTRERLVGLLCSTMFACGIAFLIKGSDPDAAPSTYHEMVLGTLAALAFQLPYDAVLKLLLKCNCVQTWQSWKRMRDCIDGCGCLMVGSNICIAFFLLLAGAVTIGRSHGQGKVVEGFQTFGWARLVSFAFTNWLTLVLFFWWARRTERKREEALGVLFLQRHIDKYQWQVATSAALPEDPPFALLCRDEVMPLRPHPEGDVESTTSTAQQARPSYSPATLPVTVVNEAGVQTQAVAVQVVEVPMQVTVPQGMSGGQMLQVQTPGGMVATQIPHGLQAGHVFQIAVPAAMKHV